MHLLSEHEQALLLKHNIRCVEIKDPEYPQLLKEIYCPPPVLYMQGQALSSDLKMIAVVGSRKADRYGCNVIDTLVPGLIAHNWTIVSGGALGADSMAHSAALKSAGKTIVILGSGLLVPYPHSNKQLFKSILNSGGTLISSFPLLTPAYPSNFPARNRIISGMSRGTIVIQAAEQSGASITARFALEQGREVFAVPGPIDNPLSKGCHKLVQQGAKLIQGVADVLEEFGEQIIDDSPLDKSKLGDNISIEHKIVMLCKKEPLSPEAISLQVNIDLQEVYCKLFDLQLEGKIKQNLVGQFEAC